MRIKGYFSVLTLFKEKKSPSQENAYYNSYVFNLLILDVIRKPKEDNLLVWAFKFQS